SPPPARPQPIPNTVVQDSPEPSTAATPPSSRPSSRRHRSPRHRRRRRRVRHIAATDPRRRLALNRSPSPSSHPSLSRIHVAADAFRQLVAADTFRADLLHASLRSLPVWIRTQEASLDTLRYTAAGLCCSCCMDLAVGFAIGTAMCPARAGGGGMSIGEAADTATYSQRPAADPASAPQWPAPQSPPPI
ncbi:Os05g0297800, partial [Oryza sativa Japonica Group]